jgi:ATP-dependent exoDNAse (exonuclease V) alpha subunit
MPFQDCTCLYTTRSDVHELNLVRLQELNQPYARITARHDGGQAAAKAPPDEAGGLATHAFLAKGIKVMITRNIWQTEGALSYAFPHSSVIQNRVDFPNGIPIVPITPLKTTFEIDGKPMTRTQLLLRLAWAVTVHKSQGLTFSRTKLGLGKREFSTGLTFVALFWVKSLDGIMMVDQVDYSCVQKLGGKHIQYRLDDCARRYHVAHT